MPHFVYPFTCKDIEVASFHLLAIVNNAIISLCAQIHLRPCFQYFCIYAQKWNYWLIWSKSTFLCTLTFQLGFCHFLALVDKVGMS